MITNFLKNLNSKKTRISLVYHSIDIQPINSVLRQNIHSVTLENFHSQLNTLKKKYRFVFIDELITLFKKNRKLHDVCAITFDDGYHSVINKALPILTDLEIPAVFYVITGLLSEKLFWRDKIRYLIRNKLESDFLAFATQFSDELTTLDVEAFYSSSKRGNSVNSKLLDRLIDNYFHQKKIFLNELRTNLHIEESDLKFAPTNIMIGNHTVNHYVLANLTKEEQEEEISSAGKYLRRFNSERSNVFCVPFGDKGSFNQDTLDIIADLGYIGCALSTGYNIKDALNMKIQSEFQHHNIVFINRFMPRDIPNVFAIKNKTVSN